MERREGIGRGWRGGEGMALTFSTLAPPSVALAMLGLGLLLRLYIVKGNDSSVRCVNGAKSTSCTVSICLSVCLSFCFHSSPSTSDERLFTPSL